LIRASDEMAYELRVLKAVEAVNEAQKRALLEKIDRHFGPDRIRRGTFAVWGLAFKPETDDMREAPSIVTVEGLLARGAAVRAHDPQALRTARAVFGDRITYCERDYDALEGADALVIITEWNQYRRPDFERIRARLRQPVLFDGRNLYAPERMASLGFTYYSIGRAPVGEVT
jgi:UDPglucose 6-dehydrogenase